MNLAEGILVEIDRSRKLLKLYESIPTGGFGATMIKQSISRAEKALAGDDPVETMRAYDDLKSNK